MINIFISLILPSVIYGWFGNPQGAWEDYFAGVKGKLICKGKGYKDAQVYLYDYYDFTTQLLNSSVSNEDGSFEISGTRKTPYTIKPKLFVHHNCLSDFNCWYDFSIDIPPEYVRKGKDGHPYYDLGKMPLRLPKHRQRYYNCILH